MACANGCVIASSSIRCGSEYRRKESGYEVFFLKEVKDGAGEDVKAAWERRVEKVFGAILQELTCMLMGFLKSSKWATYHGM